MATSSRLLRSRSSFPLRGAEEVGAWNNLFVSNFLLDGATDEVAAVEEFDGVADGAAVAEAAVDDGLVEGAWAGNEPNALGGGGVAWIFLNGGGVPAEPFTTGGAAVAVDAAAERPKGPEEPFTSIVPKLKPEDI